MTERDESALVREIAANPRNLAAYRELAGLYFVRGEHRKAELALRRLIDMDPLCPGAWVDLARLDSHRDWRTAADAWERACALEPDDPSHWLNYGAALLPLQDFDRAAGVRDRLLQDFGEAWQGHLLAGHIERICGRTDAAADAYRRALAVDPGQTDALYNLVDLAPPGMDDPLVDCLRARLAEPSLAARDEANLCFALGRVLERADLAEEAMSLYDRANEASARAMRCLGVAYDPQGIERETSRIIELFPGGAAAPGMPPLELDLELVFVVGMPRSGTTLVERIIGRHSLVAAGGELPGMQEALARLLTWCRATGREGAIDPSEAGQRSFLCELRERYIDELFERDLDAGYIVDKLPANFSAVGLIRTLFPDAIIIHSTRHALATCWSLYRSHFGLHLPYNASLQHLAHYYLAVYGRLMQHWAAGIPGIVEVKYEELVADPERVIRDLIFRCGLPWEDACLSFHEDQSPVLTASMQRVRQPITADSVDRWQRYSGWLEPLKSVLLPGSGRAGT